MNRTVNRIALLLLPLLFANPALAIKKCQDADGNWHYGDVAVSACENSKVTTLNDRGFITDELEAPKTEAEIIALEKAQAEEKAETERKANIENERLRILSIYETEADIDRQRDNQLGSIDGNIAVHEAYLKAMERRIVRYKVKQSEAESPFLKENFQKKIDEANSRIETSKKELEVLSKQKSDVQKKFAKEKSVYREIKNSSAKKKPSITTADQAQ